MDGIKQFYNKYYGKILRLWKKDCDKDMTCEYIYFVDFFIMPDNRVLIETRTYDERYYTGNKFPSSNFYFFDEVTLAYVEEDQ